MKTISIPKYKNPFTVVINNTEYVYKGGETVEVPDEVAEVIQRDIDSHTNTSVYCAYTKALVVTMKYAYAKDGVEYYSCDTPYDEIERAVGNTAVIAWYGGTQSLAKKTGDIISFSGLVRNGSNQYEWYYSTNA